MSCWFTKSPWMMEMSLLVIIKLYTYIAGQAVTGSQETITSNTLLLGRLKSICILVSLSLGLLWFQSNDKLIYEQPTHDCSLTV